MLFVNFQQITQINNLFYILHSTLERLASTTPSRRLAFKRLWRACLSSHGLRRPACRNPNESADDATSAQRVHVGHEAAVYHFADAIMCILQYVAVAQPHLQLGLVEILAHLIARVVCRVYPLAEHWHGVEQVRQLKKINDIS